MKKVLVPILASMTLSTFALAGGGVVEVEIPTVEIPMALPPLPSSDYSTLGLKVGTLGVGLDYSIPLSNYFNLRLNVNGFSYSGDTTQNSVDYSGKATLLTAGALVDYYPFRLSEFRLSAGAYYNGNKFEGSGKTTSITLNGNTYTSAQLGTLDMETKLNEVAPYIGFGWGNKGTEKGWGFSVDVGAMYHGTVGIDANGVCSGAVSVATCTQIEADIESERKKLEDDMSAFSFYPVVMLGVTYAF